MHIPPHRPSPLEPPPPARARGLHEGAALLGPHVQDSLAVSQYIGAGQLYRMEDLRFKEGFADRPPLAGEPSVTLDRPLLVVPGWGTGADRLTPLLDKLVEGGANGERPVFIRDGRFFSDFEGARPLEPGQVSSRSKVFVSVPTDRKAPPPVVAAQLERNLEALSRATGAPKADVHAYSMGGISARVYLDRGGERVGRLLMVGTPNRGTRFADLSRHVLERDIRWAISMGGLVPADMPALRWLSVDTPGGQRNPSLHDLNARWPEQAARVEAVEVIGGRGQLTPANQGWKPFGPGDGLVPEASLGLPGVRTTVVEGVTHHGHLNYDRQVYGQMIRFFGWSPRESAP